MALDYTSYTNQIANLLVIPSTEANFTTMLPGMIDYAEQRIYRDLNLLETTVTDTSVTTTANSRFVTLPQSVAGSTSGFRTITTINVLSSAGTGSSNGTRIPLVRSWRKTIDFLYPTNTSSAATSVPSLYAVLGSTTPSINAKQVILGPPPGDAFTLEISGSIRPTALSSTNTTTALTNYYPDMFVAASMVFGAGYIRDFGSQADNPAASQSWEMQYQALLQSAKAELLRERYSAAIDGVSMGISAKETEK